MGTMADSSEDPSVIRILVATDNHLGFNEKDPIRGQDSFDAFEEILSYARDLKVDMMVLGGDLFHDNKPSRKTLHTAMELLRHYCLGERECPLEYLSDPSVNFHSRFANANYLDPNLNVAIPVFAIHGNHDDPAGDGSLSSLDILSTAGLLNYFGRVKEVDDITISPIILRKGNSHLALYGLGNIRDERLFRTFSSKKVRILRPATLQDADPTNWFNLMLFHQNRAAHSPKNHIPEVYLDDFLDLIVWGHEHDCQIDPLYIPQRDFYISQPGSSCITSLSEGEATKKHVALLTVKGNQFEIHPLPLHSIRPFVFSDLILQQHGVTDQKSVTTLITSRVEQMIQQAKAQWSHPTKPCPLPLIRLRVDYTGVSLQTVNPQRFGQAFADRVANPREIIHLIRKRALPSRPSSSIAINTPSEATVERSAARVEDLIAEFLNVQRLDLLPHNEFSDTLKIFVEKDDKDAIDAFLKASLTRTITELKDKEQLEGLRHEIEKVRVSREEEWRRLNPSGESLINHRVATPSQPEEETETNPGSNVENSPGNVSKRRVPVARGSRQKRPTPLQLTSATSVQAAQPAIPDPPPVKRSRWPNKKQ